MTHTIAPDDPTLELLVEQVLSWTGYRPDPSHASAIRRVARTHVSRGVSLHELLGRVSAFDPDFVAAFLKAVSVPETYFFRQPEHFEWIASEGVARLSSNERVRAWSAGCATGEEAYSLAACLIATMLAGVEVDVLGTDLLEHSLDIARAGAYGAFSHRVAGPILYPVCGPHEGRRAKVRDEVRAVTRFQAHNLLQPAPGEFDIVLCRNVFLYFSADATRTALEHIVNALSPEGVAVFGTLDVTSAPPGLRRVGRTELNIFVREDAPKVAPRRVSAQAPRPASIAPPGAASDPVAPVAMHLRVLRSIEHDDRRGAERELLLLRAKAPDYLPGLFEEALLHVRHGFREQAIAPMRELLRRLEPLPHGRMLAGPEHLPVSYYQTAARAFLSTVGVDPDEKGAGQR
jgi:chemotaxis methyl-accepting protein methylase